MLMSMTGFGRKDGADSALAWSWEVRSVNARGLELRFRLPPGCDVLEPGLREVTQKVIRRGSVHATLSLRAAAQSAIAVDEELLVRLMETATRIAARFPGSPAPRVEGFFTLPGVLGGDRGDSDLTETSQAALRAGYEAAVRALLDARRSEGNRLARVVGGLLDEIAALREEAEREAAAQQGGQRERLLAGIASLRLASPALPEDRLAQELALLATKSDIREELDRLASHVEAARDHVSSGGAVGRQLDFLVQEFVRETNTICSKSASRALTAAGLRLKAVVEQLREQVQNLE